MVSPIMLQGFVTESFSCKPPAFYSLPVRMLGLGPALHWQGTSLAMASKMAPAKCDTSVQAFEYLRSHGHGNGSTSNGKRGCSDG